MKIKNTFFLVLAFCLHSFAQCSEETIMHTVTINWFPGLDELLKIPNLIQCIVQHKRATPIEICDEEQFLQFSHHFFLTMEQLHQTSLLKPLDHTRVEKQKQPLKLN